MGIPPQDEKTRFRIGFPLITFEIVLNKFSQNEDLKAKLLATGDEELVEGNTWGDRIWGVCNGVGENRLGKILMKIRSILQKGQEI